MTKAKVKKIDLTRKVLWEKQEDGEIIGRIPEAVRERYGLCSPSGSLLQVGKAGRIVPTSNWYTKRIKAGTEIPFGEVSYILVRGTRKTFKLFGIKNW